MSLLPPLYIIRRNDGAVMAYGDDGIQVTRIFVHFNNPNRRRDVCVWTSRHLAEIERNYAWSRSSEFFSEGSTYEVVELAEALVVH